MDLGRRHRVSLVLLLFLLETLCTGTSSAWKPIHGISPHKDGATSASYKTTSFSLKQSHPDTSSLPSYSAIYAGEPKESGSDSAELTAQALSFSNDDAEQYNSYGLADEKQFVFDSTSSGSGSVSVSGSGSDDNVSFTRNQKFFAAESCSVKKFAFNQDGVVQYDHHMVELNQFTICFWMRFTNHSGDHVLLTYADEKEPRQIQLWVSNAKNSSFLSMAIKGQQMYRLNYPLRARHWHHMCSSWNGKTGEWQVWLKAERIGRGFHNSLVGHKIPGNGKLSSGGSSVTGDVSQGLHFEITLVQIYRVALSAGKAHRDHKHHHVHHFDHEGQELLITTKATPTINRPQPMHSLLASGQIPTQVRINLANPVQGAALAQQQRTTIQQQPPQHQAITINTNFVNGQINSGSRLVAQQLLSLPLGPSSVIRKPIVAVAPTTATTHAQFDMLSNPANVQFIDETETRIQFKRQTTEAEMKANANADTNTKTNTNTNVASSGETAKRKKRHAEKNHKKRGLVLLDDGSVVDAGLDASAYKYDGLAEFGGEQFKTELTSKMSLEEAVSTHDREPAEEEVRAVMELCSACDLEPFEGAIVFAWKDVQEHMDNTLKGQSIGKCGNF